MAWTPSCPTPTWYPQPFYSSPQNWRLLQRNSDETSQVSGRLALTLECCRASEFHRVGGGGGHSRAFLTFWVHDFLTLFLVNYTCANKVIINICIKAISQLSRKVSKTAIAMTTNNAENRNHEVCSHIFLCIVSCLGQNMTKGVDIWSTGAICFLAWFFDILGGKCATTGWRW